VYINTTLNSFPYPGSMVKRVIGKDGTYALEQPSTVNLYFLVVTATCAVEDFCKNALNPEQGGRIPDVPSIDKLGNMKWKMLHASKSFELLDLIRKTTIYMCEIADECKRNGGSQRRVDSMMTVAEELYKVFVLGFADICCTMDGGDTLIDQGLRRFDQIGLPCTEKAIAKYPHLSDWVKLCNCEKWEEGMDASTLLLKNPIRQSILQEVWFMTSPSRSSTMQPLEVYKKYGHGVPGDMIDEVLFQMDQVS
jgi:hypothetical protein